MKIIKFNGLKPEIANLDYNAIKEEMERCEKKGNSFTITFFRKRK